MGTNIFLGVNAENITKDLAKEFVGVGLIRSEYLCRNINEYVTTEKCKEYFKNYDRPKKEDNYYEQLKALQYKDSLELSYFSGNINDYAFAKYNPSIYHRDKNGNLKLNKGIKVGSDVPKTINMNIHIPTQKYKYRCYNM